MIHPYSITEPIVTIVYCKNCEKSGHIAVQDNRFWCAWCNEWCQGETKQIRNVTVVSDELQTPQPNPDTARLQPLRITPGWKVGHFNHLQELDLTLEIIKDGYPFNDIIYFIHERANRLLDVGWHSLEEDELGVFSLTLWEGDFHGKQLYELETNLRSELVEEIERLLEDVSLGKI